MTSFLNEVVSITRIGIEERRVVNHPVFKEIQEAIRAAAKEGNQEISVIMPPNFAKEFADMGFIVTTNDNSAYRIAWWLNSIAIPGGYL